MAYTKRNCDNCSTEYKAEFLKNTKKRVNFSILLCKI